MQKHTDIYFKYFKIGEQDIITCEGCMKQGRADGQGFDIHHIEGRGKGKDIIENLILLCRKHHEQAHNGTLSKSELSIIHKYFLNGNREKMIK